MEVLAVLRYKPLDTFCHIIGRNVKYHPFLQMSELPVRRCGINPI